MERASSLCTQIAAGLLASVMLVAVVGCKPGDDAGEGGPDPDTAATVHALNAQELEALERLVGADVYGVYSKLSWTNEDVPAPMIFAEDHYFVGHNRHELGVPGVTFGFYGDEAYKACVDGMFTIGDTVIVAAVANHMQLEKGKTCAELRPDAPQWTPPTENFLGLQHLYLLPIEGTCISFRPNYGGFLYPEADEYATVVPCDGSHEYELLVAEPLDIGDSPTWAEIYMYAEINCTHAADRWLEADPSREKFGVNIKFWIPSEAQYHQGDRAAHCFQAVQR